MHNLVRCNNCEGAKVRRASIPWGRRNSDVIRAWGDGHPLQTRNLWTDGQDIYSYALLIGTTEDKRKVAFNYTARIYRGWRSSYAPIPPAFVSQTTSTHQLAAQEYAQHIKTGTFAYI